MPTAPEQSIIEPAAAQRGRLKRHHSAVLWFTGLSAAGKSTIATRLEQQLIEDGRHTMLLDGDSLRQGLNRDLGFDETSRIENVRRVGCVAALMAEAGLIVLVALISPFRREREAARALLPAGRFYEVFVDTPLALAEARDPKGLYRRARAGQLPQFTGIDSPYEPPLAPELHIRTAESTAADAAALIVQRLRADGLLPAR